MGFRRFSYNHKYRTQTQSRNSSSNWGVQIQTQKRSSTSNRGVQIQTQTRNSTSNRGIQTQTQTRNSTSNWGVQNPRWSISHRNDSNQKVLLPHASHVSCFTLTLRDARLTYSTAVCSNRHVIGMESVLSGKYLQIISICIMICVMFILSITEHSWETNSEIGQCNAALVVHFDSDPEQIYSLVFFLNELLQDHVLPAKRTQAYATHMRNTAYLKWACSKMIQMLKYGRHMCVSYLTLRDAWLTFSAAVCSNRHVIVVEISGKYLQGGCQLRGGA